ncbi:MAG: hypothetical protein KC729_20040 [Candidatus Eisenbacteria bacterium]|uniref:Protein kinase domain-containing protein n=1 Tax=Eiseniibacteriota bacterium TaxID=2212470 RepID=A0A956RQS0_UNCEI|nr:hypothetical protein [Candidatus Eisenbacteria bacterium]
MSGDRPPVDEILYEAARLTGRQRAEFLDASCGDDDSLRAEIESLLAVVSPAQGFLEEGPVLDSGAHGPRIASSDLVPEQELEAGTRLGSYAVVRILGIGGMGKVYLAERADDHFRQRVAIKLIKRGMDTDDIVQRFRLEREVLARL